MKALVLPPAIAKEFAIVSPVWHCGGETRRIDALVLSWVKYEKQLRRLFSFLVFQHPKVTETTVKDIVSALADHRFLYPVFMRGIKELGVRDVPHLLGDKYAKLALMPTLGRGANNSVSR